MGTFIVIRTSFEAIHCWPECPFEDVAFLRSPHRHIFHVEMRWDTSSDRQLEFIKMKRQVDAFIDANWAGGYISRKSCEEMAQRLVEFFKAKSAIVFEDLENGGGFEI